MASTPGLHESHRAVSIPAARRQQSDRLVAAGYFSSDSGSAGGSYGSGPGMRKRRAPRRQQNDGQEGEISNGSDGGLRRKRRRRPKARPRPRPRPRPDPVPAPAEQGPDPDLGVDLDLDQDQEGIQRQEAAAGFVARANLNADDESQLNRDLRHQAAAAEAAAIAEEDRHMRDKYGMRYQPTLYKRHVGPLDVDTTEQSDSYCFMCEQDLSGDVASLQATMGGNIDRIIDRCGEIRMIRLVRIVYDVYETHVRPNLTKRQGYNGNEERAEWTPNSIYMHIMHHDVSDFVRSAMGRAQIFTQWMHMYHARAMKESIDEDTGETVIRMDNTAFGCAIRASKHVTELLLRAEKARRSTGM